MDNTLITGCIGEFIGTFILVFFGCGAVIVSVLFSVHNSLFQIAVLWGIGVSLAIYATRHISCAHLNPAVSLAMVAAKRMTPKKLIPYMTGQFSGALTAAALLYLLFNASIEQYELINHITRGHPESVATARIFTNFYPDPGNAGMASVTMLNAFFAEALGTFALVFFIFSLTEGCNVGRPDDTLTPLFIGSALSLIISIVAPLTMAGLNPARDLAPRLFTYLSGWHKAAVTAEAYGYLIVYTAGPVCGALVAALLFRWVIEPIMLRKKVQVQCTCSNAIQNRPDKRRLQ